MGTVLPAPCRRGPVGEADHCDLWQATGASGLTFLHCGHEDAACLARGTRVGRVCCLGASWPGQLSTDLCLLGVCLQSVHEPTGPSEGYLQLEELVKQVVSPFLGISEDRGVSGPTYTSGKGPR